MKDKLTLIREQLAEMKDSPYEGKYKAPKLPANPRDYNPKKDRPWWHPSAKPMREGPPKKGKKSRAKPSTKVQTLIFDKKVFPSKAKAKSWAKSHGFSSFGVDETKTSYRLRQQNPSKFKSGSFRTVKLTKGVSAVVGRKK